MSTKVKLTKWRNNYLFLVHCHMVLQGHPPPHIHMEWARNYFVLNWVNQKEKQLFALGAPSYGAPRTSTTTHSHRGLIWRECVVVEVLGTPLREHLNNHSTKRVAFELMLFPDKKASTKTKEEIAMIPSWQGRKHILRIVRFSSWTVCMT